MISSELARILHQEHLETLGAMNTLEEMISGASKTCPLDVSSKPARQQLCDLIAAIERDTSLHFQFEERHLFPILDEKGYGEMTAMLIEEHNAIRPLAERLRSIATLALQDGFDSTTWRDFREAGMDLAPSVMFHIQKEEMGLIRRMNKLLDAEIDKSLVGCLADSSMNRGHGL